MGKARIIKTEQQWKDILTSEQFAVCRKHGTERPFTGEYCHCKDAGIYCCICCGKQLFDSTAKYDSGSGWPSYYQPLSKESVSAQTDNSLGMSRVEVLCSCCDAHLGHVFEDGPKPTGLRYCINSVSLKLQRHD